jgi:hypothetical protein
MIEGRTRIMQTFGKVAVFGAGGLAVAALVLSGWLTGDRGDGRATLSAAESQTANRTGAPFAVVELFTSQGCSSCPPADRNLSRIVADAERRGINVLALSFHVDYWNRLGWKDPYSDAAWTARQSAYAKVLETDGLYTPQMVVNGMEQFVGSDVEQSDRVIADALAQTRTGATLAIPAAHRQEGNLRVDYELSGARAGDSLVVVLTHDAGTNNVTRGENAGRKLTHRNVVRSLDRVASPTSRGTIDVKLPADIDSTPHRLIAFVQNDNTLAIRAAATLKVNP